MQLYENVRNTYTHFFETLRQQPVIPPTQFSSSLCSFKVLAETPLQGTPCPSKRCPMHILQRLLLLDITPLSHKN